MGLLISEPRLAEVEPDSATGRSVYLIDPVGAVKHAEHIGKAGSIGRVRRRMCDKVVMIREHAASF
jgi:hypothetical protein